MKTAVITGASRGIGRAAALRFAREGYNVAINCRKSGDEIAGVAELIRESGAECITHVGDISSYDNAAELFALVNDAWGRADVLVNNAGISRVGLFTDLSPEVWRQVIDTNLTGVYNCCSCAVPMMLKNGFGRIVNVSSIWGVAGGSCEVAYSASKGGVNAFTKALGKELARGPVRVNAVAFGPVDTRMNACLSEEDMALMKEDIPAGRLASAEEAGDFIYHVAAAGDYLTGQVIVFDGGMI
ncbi:MAG: SDR family NAD(P)-dependent oxidoreductase [Lachnospiraceae bacterium]|nr:SDR family NAD(P)-dependent oxidoreductase [Lachnospiraceae bacterium]